MDATERKQAVRNRLRRQLGKPNVDSEQARIDDALADPAAFLKSVPPENLKKALEMMQDLDASTLGSAQAELLQQMRSSAVPDPNVESTPERSKKTKKKKKKKKKSKSAEAAAAEQPPPLPDF